MFYAVKKPAMLLAASLFVALNVQGQEVDLSSDEAKLGYTYGAQVARQLVSSGFIENVSAAALTAAIADVLDGKELKMTDEEMQQAQTDFQQKMMAEQEALISGNLAKSEAYLVENAEKDGVKTTESGLQWELLTEGSGKTPNNESTVKIHYSGKLIDGTVFDSSYERGEPTTFNAGAVIPGFSEGLSLVKEGGKIRIHIPPSMGYGVQAPGNIGPNQALIFEVELLEVIEPETQSE